MIRVEVERSHTHAYSSSYPSRWVRHGGFHGMLIPPTPTRERLWSGLTDVTWQLIWRSSIKMRTGQSREVYLQHHRSEMDAALETHRFLLGLHNWNLNKGGFCQSRLLWRLTINGMILRHALLRRTRAHAFILAAIRLTRSVDKIFETSSQHSHVIMISATNNSRLAIIESQPKICYRSGRIPRQYGLVVPVYGQDGPKITQSCLLTYSSCASKGIYRQFERSKNDQFSDEKMDFLLIRLSSILYSCQLILTFLLQPQYRGYERSRNVSFYDGKPWGSKLMLFANKLTWIDGYPDLTEGASEPIPLEEREPFLARAGPISDVLEGMSVVKVLDAGTSIHKQHMASPLAIIDLKAQQKIDHSNDHEILSYLPTHLGAMAMAREQASKNTSMTTNSHLDTSQAAILLSKLEKYFQRNWNWNYDSKFPQDLRISSKVFREGSRSNLSDRNIIHDHHTSTSPATRANSRPEKFQACPYIHTSQRRITKAI
ncbi:uncharacterized protein MYCFIDRAFT_179430 [Pseudocercospora fijiensis CIRAD86]|uniref:Uncharacterized protein n=1 Tax=Pseudocercospora fijiensis (strain CIRAD86) TaxID=383855 RepID=M3AKH8_PSEFD|nr:uncharacterized protein MYCFIDRAFT_179430 [Pseudocercospora fijiensis CIRAD86]EME77977.1 hypothetical protein MYCFIDRAFT_179430 [Pseudocercospora fijiensis CIRAD86]